jgi:hypothetical protein
VAHYRRRPLRGVRSFFFNRGDGTHQLPTQPPTGKTYMRYCKSHMRYCDYCGNVLDSWGKNGGQQGDPLELIIFCLSVHHLWGRTLNKHNQDACAVAYADDGIKAKLSMALEVLSDIKHSRRTLGSPSISTRPRFSSRVFRRLMRTLPHNACSMPIPPSRSSVSCSLPRPL